MSQPLPIDDPFRPEVDTRSLASFEVFHEAARQRGLKTYGMPLRILNGRNAASDAKEELVDAWKYVTQLEIEYEQLIIAYNSMIDFCNDRWGQSEGGKNLPHWEVGFGLSKPRTQTESPSQETPQVDANHLGTES